MRNIIFSANFKYYVLFTSYRVSTSGQLEEHIRLIVWIRSINAQHANEESPKYEHRRDTAQYVPYHYEPCLHIFSFQNVFAKIPPGNFSRYKNIMYSRHLRTGNSNLDYLFLI